MYQDNLSTEEYKNLMLDRVDELHERQFDALRELEKEKLKVTKAYNKKVQEKSFQVENLVWKTILLVQARDNKFGK
jgi:hypothetical protein